MSVFQHMVLIFFIISSASVTESYRILGIFPYNGRSHNVMFNPLMRGLAKRGHQVDHVTHFPVKKPPPNYKVIINLNGTLERVVNNFTIEWARAISSDLIYFAAVTYGNDVCKLLSLKEMQKLIKDPPNNPPYDLVITEAFGANCFIGLGHLLKVPVVTISTSVEYPWITDFTGNNDNLAVVPNPLLPNFDKTKFWVRLKNVLSHYSSVFSFHHLTGETQTALMRKYLSPDMPHIREVERSVALTLVNSHPVIFGPKPITSSVVEVGGLHIEGNNTQLPLDLQKWLDESKDGVVYFTLGSLILIESFPAETIEAFYRSFSKIAPVRVLMKIFNAQKLPPGLPQNVLTSPWIPQESVLGHQNVHAFITHGGLMGSQETLYYGVPTIGIPIFGDQVRNIQTFVVKNMGVEIDFNNISTASIDDALNKVLKNPMYRKNAKYYSKLFRDRPLSAMDTAIFWIEYVVRNGPNVLRSPALDLYWWQLALIDVYAFLYLILTVTLILSYYLTKLLLGKCFSKLSSKTKRE